MAIRVACVRPIHQKCAEQRGMPPLNPYSANSMQSYDRTTVEANPVDDPGFIARVHGPAKNFMYFFTSLALQGLP